MIVCVSARARARACVCVCKMCYACLMKGSKLDEATQFSTFNAAGVYSD